MIHTWEQDYDRCILWEVLYKLEVLKVQGNTAAIWQL